MIVKARGMNAEPGQLVELKREQGGWYLIDDGKSYPVLSAAGLDVLGRTEYKALMKTSDSAMVIRFADLHGHTDNSLLDGMVKVKDKAKAAEYCAAITDHGVLYGFVEFYKAMRALKKKPIVGFEAYCENLEGELKRNHLILLAKNLTGYHNLIKLCSEASEHFKGKPHVTWDMLERYHEGVICTSACLAGIIPQYMLAGDMQRAEEAFCRYHTIFGEDFYIEIQRHYIEEEDRVRPLLVKMAKTHGVKYIATNDSHYLHKEDAKAHEVLLCLQTKKTIDEPHMTFPGTGYHIHSSEEMEALFKDYPEALDYTLDLADTIDLEIPLGEVNLPSFAVPDGFADEEEYFDFLCQKGFRDRFKGTAQLKSREYHERFRYEVDMVKQMGFCGYFLIVWDFINFARENNIYVGPGRGSAAGSLVAYCLGITDIDPIPYNLLFERFLNPERVSMPDIDTDFEHTRRQEVYDYCCRKYGEDAVSHIITFGTMAARMVVKDVARVLGYPPSFAAVVAKQIPAEVNMTIDKAMLENPDLKHSYDTQPDVKKVIDIAKALEGGKRHASQHACGVVVGPGPISNWIPTALVTDDETGEKGLTAQVTMSECEELSLLKMDFLGLKNMTAIHEVHDGVIRDFGLKRVLGEIGSKKREFRYQDIPLTDRETYKMLASGQTSGVFQLESPGMTRVIIEMFSDLDAIPDEELGQCFERLIAAVALYRPGPMDYIPDYQAGMRDPSAIHYDCPEEESILAPTYGVLVFQEQLMQVAQKLAGYSLGEADVIRKGAAKKKEKVLLAEHGRFVHGNKEEYEKGIAKHLIPGCVGNGIPEEVAEEIWSKMTKFGRYAFNKSHAACYAVVAYLTAYMSCHWPIHFYCAMLNAFIDIPDKVKGYLSQAVRRGITILPPDINRSKEQFSVDMEAGGIRFGLRGIANLNKIVGPIIAEREAGGPFDDLEDFYLRLSDGGKKLGKKQLEQLIFSGATAAFGYNRREQQALVNLIITDAENTKDARAIGQYTLFDTDKHVLEPPQMSEYDKKELLEKEYNSLGVYLSDHPVNDILAAAMTSLNPKPVPISDLIDTEEESTRATVVGQIRELQRRFTKAGQPMYHFELQDQFNALPCVVFPSAVPAVEPLLTDGNVIAAYGKYQKDETFGDQLIVEAVYSEAAIMMAKSQKLTVTVRDKADQTAFLAFVQTHPGNVPVVLKAPTSPREYETAWKVRLNAAIIDEIMQRWRIES